VSDDKATNPKDQQATTRVDLSLFPDSAVAYGALAFTEGDLKYGAYNWRVAGVQTSVYIAALRRHVAKYYNGEWADPKTGVPHLANALACIAVLIDSHEQGNLNDDRPPKQSAGLYIDMEEKVAALQEKFPRRAGRYRADEADKRAFEEFQAHNPQPPQSAIDAINAGAYWDGSEWRSTAPPHFPVKAGA